jgi:hypothetical protein
MLQPYWELVASDPPIPYTISDKRYRDIYGDLREFPQVLSKTSGLKAHLPTMSPSRKLSSEAQSMLMRVLTGPGIEGVRLRAEYGQHVDAWPVRVMRSVDWELQEISIPEVYRECFDEPDGVPVTVWVGAKHGVELTYIGADLIPIIVSDFDQDGTEDVLFAWVSEHREGYLLAYAGLQEQVIGY